MKGSITSRGKNAWRLRYELPSAMEGVRKQASETVHGPKKLAQQVLRERLAALDTGNYVSKTRETVGQFMESWMSGYAVSHVGLRTLDGYRGNMDRYIVPYLGSMPIQNLQPRHVQEFHSWMLDKNLSRQTTVHAHRLLSQALKHAVAWGVIPQNPAGQVSPPRPDTGELEIWDIDTLQRFLDVVESTPLVDIFKLALFTGMRRSELTGLKWDAVDFENRVLRVTGTLQRINGIGLVAGPPKTRASRRSIALGHLAMAVLNKVRGRQLEIQLESGGLYDNNGRYVFTDELGHPISSDRISREFARVVRQFGLPRSTFHGLRHCHASLLLADGVNIKAISERLGHSNVAITLNIYSHLLPNIQEEAADGIDRQLAPRERWSQNGHQLPVTVQAESY